MIPNTAVPSEIPLVNVSNEILLPSGVMRLPISTNENAYLNKYLMKSENNSLKPVIGVIPCKDKSCLMTSQNKIGTAAFVLQSTNSNWPKQRCMITVMGISRFQVNNITSRDSLPLADVTPLVDTLDEKNEEQVALMKEFKEVSYRLMDVLHMFHPLINRIKKTMDISDTALVDLSANMISSSYQEKLDILNTVDLTERIKKILPALRKQIEGLELVEDSLKKGEIPKRGLPVLKLLRTRIPHTDGMMEFEEGDDLSELQEKLKKAKLPDYAQKVAFKEFQRLKRMSPFSPEHGVIRSYVELMSELPWSISSKETIDLRKAKKDLDADHYGMDKLKRRVLEYLAVRQLKNNLRGPILCFVGPPGVGKTSIGRSIAQTLGREFHRISLGGLCNQSDIRGHRRTYVGALPGRIIQAIKAVGVNNPVILLDEIDKMSSGLNGDPGAALLEVLDPEQNYHFVDHYLNVPFDLSQVSFIATANRVSNISPALLDRMEVIHVSGYTQEEKFHIAQRHLLPKQLLQHGLTKDTMTFPPETLKLLISGYTREAGVRTLERKLAALCRAVAVNVAEKQYDQDDKKISLPVVIDSALLDDILGPALYDENEIWCRVGVPGVAVGLAWTSAGGEVMLVEASKMTGGSGELVLTGHLGSVMKESAKLALNWVRTVAVKYGLLNENGDLMNDTDVHIHFPAGAVGKDGPSAGVTIATALISLFAEMPIASDIAITGEITLRGLVLPVGGVRDKVLAAHRAGLKRVILPKKCEKDLTEIPQNIMSEMTMVFVNHMHEVIEAAFNGEISPVRHTKSLKSKL